MKLKPGYTYIVKSNIGGVSKWKCVEESKLCVKIEYENGNTNWYEKLDLQYSYTMIEELGKTGNDILNQIA